MKRRRDDTDLLNAMLTRSVPRSLNGSVRDKDGAWPDDMEIEDGYPSNAAVEAIGMVAVADARRWLLEVFPDALRATGYAKVSVVDSETERRIEFSTGGWSGSEAIAWAVLEHPVMRLYRSSEFRGGHYVFKVPLDKEPAQ